MHLDRLFLATMDDLEKRVARGDLEYDVLGTAALLRKLLLDSTRLVDVVNRKRRVKVSYVVNGRPPIWKQLGEPPPAVYAIEDGFEPLADSLPVPMPVEVNRDGLLACFVMFYRGHEITVKDLIHYVAHVAGGVHVLEPKTEGEKAAQSAAKAMSVGGYPAGNRTLRAVGRVVVKGLEPLRRQVEEDLGDRPPSP